MFPRTIVDVSDQYHHLYNLCESSPILIKLDGSMMELRSAIQVLGISPDRWSWWGLGAEGGQGWNQLTRMFLNISTTTNNNKLFRFLALTLLHHNVAWRLATSLFRFSFFFAFLHFCDVNILTVFYFHTLTLHTQVEGVLVTMMTHPEVVELIRGILLLIQSCQNIKFNKIIGDEYNTGHQQSS